MSQWPDEFNVVKVRHRHAWMSFIVLACAAGAPAATGPNDQAAVEQAIVHLTPDQQARIESSKVWYQTPRTPGRPSIYFLMRSDPCSSKPSTGCEVNNVRFRLRDQAPLAGTCVRQFITIALDQDKRVPPTQRHGERQIALGSDCAAIDSSHFARLDGVGLDEAARLLLWLKAQQAMTRQPSDQKPAQIECAQSTPSRDLQEGCAGGAQAAFARLPLSSTSEIGRIKSAPHGVAWKSGQHFALSVWPKPGGMGYRLQVHLGPDSHANISMRWEPPAPF